MFSSYVIGYNNIS